MKRRTEVLLLVAAAATLAGCEGVPVHIENAVPPDIDRSQVRIIEADAHGYQILLLIPVALGTRHARAWEELQEKAGDAYITDVELREGWYWALIGTVYHSTFRAKAYPRNRPADPPPDGLDGTQ